MIDETELLNLAITNIKKVLEFNPKLGRIIKE